MHQVLPSALSPPELKKIPIEQIAVFIEQAGGLTPAGFRARLVEFLSSKKVVFPPRHDIEPALREARFPSFRKVKVFELVKHFVVRK